MFPKDKKGFDIDDQYYIGQFGLLVKPVTKKNKRDASVYLAEDQVRFAFFTVSQPSLSHCVFPCSTGLVQLLRDPFTLRIALSNHYRKSSWAEIFDGTMLTTVDQVQEKRTASTAILRATFGYFKGMFGGMTGKPRKVCSDFPDIGVVFDDVLTVVFDGFVE